MAREARDTVGYPGAAANLYKLTPEYFEAHLDAIAGVVNGRAPSRLVRLTFDDGGASAIWVASALERRGLLGTFFVVTSRIGTSGFMDADGLQWLAERGHEIGSHSDTHPAYMGRLDRAALAREWSQSRNALEQLLGRAPRAAAVPGGSVSRSVVEEAARAGYERLYTSTPRIRATRERNMLVSGRFSIWASDSPATASAIARGEPRTRMRRWLGWQAKSAAKRVSPGAYEAVRRAAAARRSAATRNDSRRSV